MEKESERKTHNTAYIPTKCRVTKPVPPKPATNPLQFVAVRPSPLLIKAQQQVKKVEIVKEARKEQKEEPEDWQSNLDNWKSSRRKRQEHIIERVEEVKKLELEEKERSRRRGTTFSEMLEKRNKGRFSIPIYDNDSNDLSDYGIGSSSSKTNSIKDVDTDDNSSILDEKENSYEEPAAAHNDADEKPRNAILPLANSLRDIVAVDDDNDKKEVGSSEPFAHCKPAVVSGEQYTYEGAIEDYRSRIRSKVNINEPSALAKLESAAIKSKEFEEAQSLLPKGNLCERKKLFENNNAHETVAPKHISEEFTNAQSIKERLQSLEKCTVQPISTPSATNVNGNNRPDDALVTASLKTRMQHFNSVACDSDAKNNNASYEAVAAPPPSPPLPPASSGVEYASSGFNASHAYDVYLETIKSAHMDALNIKDEPEMNGFRASTSTSSSDLLAASSDREDSGIHTADVSCSVSQSDEPVEDDVVNVHDTPNYKTITEAFLHAEKEFADKSHNACEQCQADQQPTHSPLVEHIAKSMQSVPLPLEEEEEALAVDVDDKVFDFYENVKTPFSMDSINDIFTNGGTPKLKPPTEKPPPPPPLLDENDLNANSVSPSIRIKKELIIKRSSFLGLEESVINEQLEQLEIQEKEKEIEMQQVIQPQLQRQMQQILQPVLLSNETDEEIMKKEREIIEMVEKEEKYKDYEHEGKRNVLESKDLPVNTTVVHTSESSDIYLGNKKFDEPFYPEPCYNDLDDQDSEVLKVEHELLQLEKEELKRKRDNLLFQERSAKLKESSNLYENMSYAQNFDMRKSMPDLNNIPPMVDNNHRQVHVQTRHDRLRYQKSMPNIQPVDSYSTPQYNLGIPINHRKSMPDLDRSVKSAFTPTSANNNLLMPIKPLMPLDRKDRYMCQHPMESDAYMHQTSGRGVPRQIPPGMRSRSTPREPWIQPKANPQAKSYNQHWLYQEAELRRLADQQKAAAIQNRQNHHHHINDKGMREPNRIINEIKSPKRNVDPLSQKDYVNLPFINRQHQPAYGHALPMSSYSQPMLVEEGHDLILSVSGKKKCSYCNKELGRGAAMIIESLSLFYHMECFKCCVCHMELGDGLMGTDVRVRNQKLHCHNCYSSDDGIKFSCV